MKKITKMIIMLLILISGNRVQSQTYSVKSILCNKEIFDFAIEEEIIWICTGDGELLKSNFSSEIIETVTLIKSVGEKRLYAIAIDTNRVKWIPTEGSGVFSYDDHDITKNGLVMKGKGFSFSTIMSGKQ